jgi:hypothetical protein
MSEQFPIPVAALAPAANEWMKPETPSMFDGVFDSADQHVRKRRTDPSYTTFIARRATKAETRFPP